ncbi:MAG: hypothetical protein C0622_05630 [Desulfuromonas sp.]|nr:MAG: hypothetical protein C0622_05630 [Desulfuromonas sp.]
MKKRYLFTFIVLMGISLGIFLFSVRVSGLSSQNLASAPLGVERPQQQSFGLHESAVVELHGSGLDQDVRITLVHDSAENQSLVTTFPVMGLFNVSLVHNGILYLGSSVDGLKVVDIRDALRPRLLGEYLPGKSVQDIHWNKDFLYVACSGEGIVKFQTGKSRPLVQRDEIRTPFNVFKMKTIQGFLAVAGGAGGVVLYDDHGTRINQFMRSGVAVGLEVHCDQLYVYSLKKALVYIYSIGENGNEKKVGEIALEASVKDVKSYKDRLFLTTSEGLYEYDPAAIEKFRLQKRISNIGAGGKIYSGKDRLYVVDGFSQLLTVDPSFEVPYEKLFPTTDVRTIVEQGQYLYVTGLADGLQVLDTQLISRKDAARNIYPQGGVRDIYVDERRIFVAANKDGVLFSPRDSETDFERLSSRKSLFFKHDRGRLFVAQVDDGCEVFDISTPSPGTPRRIGLWPDIPALKFAVKGDLLITTRGIHGVSVYDISDLKKPVLLDTVAKLDKVDVFRVLGVAISGDYLFTACSDQGLVVFRLAENGELSFVAKVVPPFPMNQFLSAIDVTLSEKTAYVACSGFGVMVVDVKNPNKPTIKAVVDVDGVAKRSVIDDNRLYVSVQDDGIKAYDISKPFAPRFESFLAVHGISFGVQVVDDALYLARNFDGVMIFPVPVRVEEVNVISPERLRLHLPAVNYPGRYDLQVNSPTVSVTHDGVFSYR